MKVLLAAISGLVVAVALASPSRAAGDADVLFVSSGIADVGDEVTVTVGVAKTVGLPNGAWVIDITYDNTIMSAVACEPLAGSVCSPVFTDDTIRSTGATATAIEAPMDFARIRFRCDRGGRSSLSMSVSVWFDATGISQEKVELEEGIVTCTEQDVPEATATVLPALPNAGGQATPSKDACWFGVLLAVVGSGLLTGTLAFRRYASPR